MSTLLTFNPISAHDSIYFVITDRFSSVGPCHPDVDRNNPFGYHGGNFKGLLSKIPYLKNLGITAIWITPVYSNLHPAQFNPLSTQWGYHGYWPHHFGHVDPHLYYPGDNYPPNDKRYLREVVDAVHAAGMKLILDMVVNHTGYHHPAYFENGLTNTTPLKKEWFNPPREGWDEESWIFGLPDLNHRNPDVVRYFINNIIEWIEQCDIDAIRMDTVMYVERNFWDSFKTIIRSKYPGVSLIGEVLDFNTDEIAKYMRYHDFTSVYDFPLQSAMVSVFAQGASFRQMARPWVSPNEPNGALDYTLNYTNPARLVTLLDNHDLNKRFMTACLDHCKGDRALALRRFKMALTFLITTRGIPQIYYGTEIGMEGSSQVSDAEMRRDMPWDIFNGGLEPSSDHPNEKEVFLHLKQLLKLRKDNEALQFSTPLTLFVDDYVYVYLQEFHGNAVIVAFNNGDGPMPTPLTVHVNANPRVASDIKTLLNNKTLCDQLVPAQAPIAVRDGSFELKLPAKTGAVYLL